MNASSRFPVSRPHVSVWAWILILACSAVAVLANGGGTGLWAVGLAVTRTLIPVPLRTTYKGVAMEIAPVGKGLTVKVTIVNRGHLDVRVARGGLAGLSVSVFDGKGRRLEVVVSNHPPSAFFRLGAGKSLSSTFDLSWYVARRGGVGTFYVRALRAVVAKGLTSSWLRTPTLRLTLRKGAPPVWKVVAAPPPPPAPGYRRPAVVAAQFPRYKIPAAGPIATLAEIAAAVRAGALQRVRQLCYNGHHGPEPFYVAFAQRAVAAARCIQAVKKRFGVNPWPHLVPSPEVFYHILRRLDPGSVHVNGNRASVGVLWFHDGKFVPFPSFAYHFRKIHGHWLLDSWATQSSSPRVTPGLYRLNVENSLREAAVFDGLARDVAAGKFASLHTFMAAARVRLAAQGRWFMAHATPSAAKPPAPAPSKARAAALPRAYHGVGIAIRHGRKRLVLVATITNRSGQTAIVWHGGPFSWRLLVFNARGWGLGVTKAQQKRWQAPQPGKRRIHLRPGASLSRIFHVRRYCVLPAQGIFYLYVVRFVAVGGASCPVASPILRLTLKRGVLPVWKVVSAVPQPKLRPPAP